MCASWQWEVKEDDITEALRVIKEDLYTLNITIDKGQETGDEKGYETGFSTMGVVRRGTNAYTARVESMVPSIGWGYINQDFTSSNSGNFINQLTLVGSSYATGVTIGRWAPNYSYVTYGNHGYYADIHMKGVINYFFDFLGIDMAATFQASVRSVDGVIVDNY